MDDDFATAMRRSLEQARAGRPLEATRTIQAALSGTGGRQAQDAPAPETSPAGLDAGTERKARAPSAPDGAVFERRHHAGPHGARDYHLFRPSDLDAPVRGVILMLHGCTQTPEDFATGTRMNDHAERHGLVVAYPEQAPTHNATRCWNWFRPEDRTRSGGEAALLADLAATVAADHGVPRGRVFAAGLSAGGAMAAILAQTHPEIVAAAGVHSGLAPGSASDVISAFGAMRGDPVPDAQPLNAPAIIFHGSADSTVAPVNAGRLRYDALRALNAGGHPVEVWRIEGAGHAWSGGDAGGSYADTEGPDASAEMVRFFSNMHEGQRLSMGGRDPA